MEKMQVFDKMSKDPVIKNKKTPTLGIDLGTTNSCAAILKEGAIPKVIPMRNGNKTLQSCVMWTGKGDEYVVGQTAYNNRYKPNVIYSVKRLMGTDEKVVLTYNKKEKVLTPEEVSAKILMELMDNVKDTYGEIKDVVITVPAYFNNKQLEATRKAGELAGLNVLKTFREPTAASLVYDVKANNAREELILVYDLGGGTFDVSLLRVSNDVDCSDLDELYGFPENVAKDTSNGKTLAVIKTDGDSRLGGDDIDNELFNIIMDKLKSQGLDVDHLAREYKEELKLNLERKKKNGSMMYELVIKTKLNDAKGTKVDTKVILSPDDFYEATRRIYKRTKARVDSVLNGINVNTISSIVLVGGSTKSIELKRMLRSDFPGIQINDALNPDEAVALGAAVEANRVKYAGETNVQVFDVLPQAIGISADMRVNRVIPKNQVVPYSAVRQFTNSRDDQEVISVDVYQGNSPIEEECTFLGTLKIDNIPKGPAGTVPILVKLTVNAEGLLKCAVKVGDIFEEKTLVNLFAGTIEKKEPSKEGITKDLTPIQARKYNRWKRFASTTKDAEVGKLLLTLLEEYVNDNENRDKIESKIIDLIKNNKGEIKKVKLLDFTSDADKVF